MAHAWLDNRSPVSSPTLPKGDEEVTRATSASAVGARELFEACTALFERAHPYAVEVCAWDLNMIQMGSFGITTVVGSEPWDFEVSVDATGAPESYQLFNFNPGDQASITEAYDDEHSWSVTMQGSFTSAEDAARLIRVVRTAAIYPMMERIFAYMPAGQTQGICWLGRENGRYLPDTYPDGMMTVPVGIPRYNCPSVTGQPFLPETDDEALFLKTFWELVKGGHLVDVTAELAGASEPFVFAEAQGCAFLAFQGNRGTQHVPGNTALWYQAPTDGARKGFKLALESVEPNSEQDCRMGMAHNVARIPQQLPSFIGSKASA